MSSLTGMIQRREWKAVVSKIKSNPSEASVEQLHLHEACKYDPPMSVISAFVRANSRFRTTTDENGEFPIHTACFYGASAEVIAFLTDWNIEALSARTRVGNQTPLEIAQTTMWENNAENQGSIIKFLQKTTFPAFFDDLTDLPRKKAFEKWAHVSPHGDCYAFVFFIDVVGFKYLNDSGGQDVGDSAIKMYASSIEKECRVFEASSVNAESTVGLTVDVFRVGGDEFVVLVKSVADAEESSPRLVWKLICKTLLPNLASLKESTYHTFVRVGCSAGMVSTSKDAEEIRKRADRLQNEAKAQLKTIRGEKPLLSEYHAEGMSKVNICNRLLEWDQVPSRDEHDQVFAQSIPSTMSKQEDIVCQQVVIQSAESALVEQNPRHTGVPRPRNHLCSWCLRYPRSRKILLFFILSGTALIVTAGIILGVVLGENGGSTEASNAARIEAVKRIVVVKSISSNETLADVNSPQHKAARWLAINDTAQVSMNDHARILQRYILAVLYYSTDGDNWKRKHRFLSGTHECDWHMSRRSGVISCNSSNSPKELKLDSSGLAGVIPSELGKLEALTDVSLKSNMLGGEIPSSMGLLQGLSTLNLCENNLVGTVPSSFNNLSSLVTITLEGNGLSGDLTAFCDAWDGIEYFSVDLWKVTCPCCHCCSANRTRALPSLPPSTLPSLSPTKSPTTSSPSQPVSHVPSFHPTTHPTTHHPTELPSTSPSQSPLEPPTRRPETVPPTRSPSFRPTRRPTERPTKFPTSKPSKQPSPGNTAIKRYPDCDVAYPEWIGDGECDEGEYDTMDCGWDGGDCGNFHPLYPRCVTYSPDEVGDGWCQGGPFNTEECDWDGGDCIEYNELYPDCGVELLFVIGDGECDDGEYMTEECGWDWGDCADVIDLYPDCHVENSGNIGNGHCNGGEYNTVECGWDGGDCVDFNELYPHCRVENPGLIGNGRCDGGSYNTVQCGRDGGDCVDFNERYPNCPTDCPECIGDGYCYTGSENTKECGYDGGDCCKQSCTPGRFWNCEGPGTIASIQNTVEGQSWLNQ